MECGRGREELAAAVSRLTAKEEVVTERHSAPAALQLMEHDALGAHARDELGLSDQLVSRPLQAAFASAATFSVGAALPILAVLLASRSSLAPVVSGASLICLAAISARRSDKARTAP